MSEAMSNPNESLPGDQNSIDEFLEENSNDVKKFLSEMHFESFDLTLFENIPSNQEGNNALEPINQPLPVKIAKRFHNFRYASKEDEDESCGDFIQGSIELPESFRKAETVEISLYLVANKTLTFNEHPNTLSLKVRRKNNKDRESNQSTTMFPGWKLQLRKEEDCWYAFGPKCKKCCKIEAPIRENEGKNYLILGKNGDKSKEGHAGNDCLKLTVIRAWVKGQKKNLQSNLEERMKENSEEEVKAICNHFMKNNRDMHVVRLSAEYKDSEMSDGKHFLTGVSDVTILDSSSGVTKQMELDNLIGPKVFCVSKEVVIPFEMKSNFASDGVEAVLRPKGDKEQIKNQVLLKLSGTFGAAIIPKNSNWLLPNRKYEFFLRRTWTGCETIKIIVIFIPHSGKNCIPCKLDNIDDFEEGSNADAMETIANYESSEPEEKKRKVEQVQGQAIFTILHELETDGSASREIENTIGPEVSFDKLTFTRGNQTKYRRRRVEKALPIFTDSGTQRRKNVYGVLGLFRKFLLFLVETVIILIILMVFWVILD